MGNNGTKSLEIIVPLMYLSNFHRTLEITLISYKINLDLNWYKEWGILAIAVATQGTTFSITDTKLYIPGLPLSTQDNTKPLEQLKSGFKRAINWN